MPQLKAELIVRAGAPFGAGASNPIQRRVAQFLAAERRARTKAAEVATRTSQSTFKYVRPPVPGAQRASRHSTGGRFASFINWRPLESGGVALDVSKLDTEAPHWPILELGTGQRGKMRYGGDETEGVQARSATTLRIKSQRGRRIHGSLVFADTLGGAYTPPGARRNQQLFFRSQVTGAPRRRTPIIIKREIQGQHFIRKGAQAGFRQYQQSVTAAARQAFRKGNAP
jgi:hypothetical protein